MLKNGGKKINISAVSTVRNKNGEPEMALAMYSTIEEDGKPSINLAIPDIALYESHMAEADADFAEFKKDVLEQAKTYKEGM